MRKIIFSFLILFSVSAYADPTVFGLTIGKTTAAEAKKYTLGLVME